MYLPCEDNSCARRSDSSTLKDCGTATQSTPPPFLTAYQPTNKCIPQLLLLSPPYLLHPLAALHGPVLEAPPTSSFVRVSCLLAAAGAAAAAAARFITTRVRGRGVGDAFLKWTLDLHWCKSLSNQHCVALRSNKWPWRCCRFSSSFFLFISSPRKVLLLKPPRPKERKVWGGWQWKKTCPSCILRWWTVGWKIILIRSWHSEWIFATNFIWPTGPPMPLIWLNQSPLT